MCPHWWGDDVSIGILRKDIQVEGGEVVEGRVGAVNRGRRDPGQVKTASCPGWPQHGSLSLRVLELQQRCVNYFSVLLQNLKSIKHLPLIKWNELC